MDKRERILDLIGDYWDAAFEEGQTGLPQSDRANEILSEIQAALTPPRWIPCSERLPTEADRDDYGQIWMYTKGAMHEVALGPADYMPSRCTHWMPTGLTKPNPPEGV